MDLLENEATPRLPDIDQSADMVFDFSRLTVNEHVTRVAAAAPKREPLAKAAFPGQSFGEST